MSVNDALVDDELAAETAEQALRCAYLARLLERRGNPEAAARWQAIARRWARRFQKNTHAEKPASR